MKIQERSKQDMLDIALEELKRKHDNGQKNPTLYKAKIQNLNLIKEALMIGSEEWEKSKNLQEL